MLPEDLHPPSCYSREQSRSQVSGRVQGVATVKSHRHTDGHDDQSDGQRLHTFRSSDVSTINDSEDTQNQHTCPHHLHEQNITGLQDQHSAFKKQCKKHR